MSTADLDMQVLGSFGGQLLRRGDAGYEEHRHVHNGLIDKYPSLIARCVTTADVVECLCGANGRSAAGRP